MNQRTKKQAYQVGFLQERDQIRLFKLCLTGVKGDTNFLREVSLMTDRILRPFLKCDSWMEGRFEADMKLRPKDVAYQCRRYMEIDPRMTPFLRSLARRIKQRVLMRRKNEQERGEVNRIEGLPFDLWEKKYFTDLKKEIEAGGICPPRMSGRPNRLHMDSAIRLIEWMKERLAKAPTPTPSELSYEAYCSHEFNRIDPCYLVYLAESLKDMAPIEKKKHLRENRTLLREILKRAHHSPPQRNLDPGSADHAVWCNAIGGEEKPVKFHAINNPFTRSTYKSLREVII